eukprot:565149-Prorocentrum_minimum.AAC.1
MVIGRLGLYPVSSQLAWHGDSRLLSFANRRDSMETLFGRSVWSPRVGYLHVPPPPPRLADVSARPLPEAVPAGGHRRH